MPLTAHNLSFSYTPTKPILRDLSASFAAGQITAILGPNGSGKSTLLRLLLGLRTPQSGRITLAGRDITSLSRRDRAARLAYIPQASSIAFPFSVRQVIRMGRYAAEPATAYQTSARRARAIDAALDRLDLTPLADEPFGTLSAGQQQRVAFARALAQLDQTQLDQTQLDPAQPIQTQPAPAQPAQTPPDERALLADEPVSAMDPRHALRCLNALRDLARAGLAVVIVLHDLPTALTYADHALLLAADGSIAAAGPTREILTPQALQSVFSVPFEPVHNSTGRISSLIPIER